MLRSQLSQTHRSTVPVPLLLSLTLHHTYRESIIISIFLLPPPNPCEHWSKCVLTPDPTGVGTNSYRRRIAKLNTILTIGLVWGNLPGMTTHRRPPGRPHLLEADRLDQLIQVTVTARDLVRLDRQVERTNSSRAGFVRHATLGLLDMLEQEDQGARPGGLANLVPEPPAGHQPASPTSSVQITNSDATATAAAVQPAPPA